VRSVSAHSRKRKLRRNGRHTSPSQAQKVARRAGKAAPAVAVVGALAAAAPHIHVFGQAAPAAAAGPSATIDLVAPGQAMSALPGLPDSVRNGADAPQPIKAAIAHRPARPASTPAPSPSPSSSGQGGSSGGTGQTLSCSGSSGMLPQNYAAIVEFLTAHGYTGLAAAGIAGNIYQESGGNPESVGSGGGGLIGWTPLPAGYVTGDSSADLQTQLAAILTFNQQWSQYLPALNAASSASEAADIYVTDFERAGIPAASNREAAAEAVAAACGL
jgi:hypothetical protein